MNPNQHFFQAFFGPQAAQVQQQIPEYILYNESILEIYNNWGCAKELMIKYKQGKLKQIDVLEQSWYNFLTTNNIDIIIYNNEDEFLKTYWKIPNN